MNIETIIASDEVNNLIDVMRNGEEALSSGVYALPPDCRALVLSVDADDLLDSLSERRDFLQSLVDAGINPQQAVFAYVSYDNDFVFLSEMPTRLEQEAGLTEAFSMNDDTFVLFHIGEQRYIIVGDLS